MAEYQNDPESRNPAAANALVPDEIAAKVAGGIGRGVVPRNCTRLTAFIDVGGDVLWYVVVAWDERFGGCVIDYGAYPDQRRDYFAKNDARPALGDVPGLERASQDAAIYAALTAVAGRVLDRTYAQEETGAPMSVELCPVDANWGPATDLVYDFVRRSPHKARLLASHGKFIGASSNPMSSWQVRPGERSGPGWRLSNVSTHRGRHVTIDVNQWKTFVAERLRTPPGGAGCLSLFAQDPKDGRSHRMVADHFAAEYPVEVTMKASDRTVQEWKQTPGRDNDWWDCAVGATVAASIQGLAWSPSGLPAMSREKKPRLKLSEIQARKRAAAGVR
jgi:phage terminase large subunit GpA-like protein